MNFVQSWAFFRNHLKTIGCFFYGFSALPFHPHPNPLPQGRGDFCNRRFQLGKFLIQTGDRGVVL